MTLRQGASAWSLVPSLKPKFIEAILTGIKTIDMRQIMPRPAPASAAGAVNGEHPGRRQLANLA